MAELKTLMEEKKGLIQELNATKAELREKTVTLESMRETRSISQDMLRLYSARIHQEVEKILELEVQNQQKDTEIQRLNELVLNLQLLHNMGTETSSINKEQQRHEFVAQIQDLTKDLAKLQSIIEKRDRDIARLQEEKKSLVKDLNATRANLKRILECLEDGRHMLRFYSSKWDKEKWKTRELEVQNEKKDKEIQQLKQLMSCLESEKQDSSVSEISSHLHGATVNAVTADHFEATDLIPEEEVLLNDVAPANSCSKEDDKVIASASGTAQRLSDEESDDSVVQESDVDLPTLIIPKRPALLHVSKDGKKKPDNTRKDDETNREQPSTSAAAVESHQTDDHLLSASDDETAEPASESQSNGTNIYRTVAKGILCVGACALAAGAAFKYGPELLSSAVTPGRTYGSILASVFTGKYFFPSTA